MRQQRKEDQQNNVKSWTEHRSRREPCIWNMVVFVPVGLLKWSDLIFACVLAALNAGPAASVHRTVTDSVSIRYDPPRGFSRSEPRPLQEFLNSLLIPDPGFYPCSIPRFKVTWSPIHVGRFEPYLLHLNGHVELSFPDFRSQFWSDASLIFPQTDVDQKGGHAWVLRSSDALHELLSLNTTVTVKRLLLRLCLCFRKHYCVSLDNTDIIWSDLYKCENMTVGNGFSGEKTRVKV